MTEQQYQAGRKVMASANFRRGKITMCKNEVGRLTSLEGHYRENMRHAQADGVQKMILVAIEKLKEARQKFADLKFPE
jgi:hypothetical protein